MPNWLIWFIVAIGYSLINYPIVIWGYKKRLKRRDVKFLKAMKVEFPGHQNLTFIAIDTSDEAAMAKLERQILDEL